MEETPSVSEECARDVAVKMLEHYLEKVKSGELKVSNIEEERGHERRESPEDTMRWQFRFNGKSKFTLWFEGRGTDWE